MYLFNTITPTPFVPFTVQRKKAAVGIMITASHNPKEDNVSLKLYEKDTNYKISSFHILFLRDTKYSGAMALRSNLLTTSIF